MFSSFSLSVCILFSCFLTLFGSTTWNELTTTYGKFYSVPLTSSDAISKKWSLLMSCNDTSSPGNLYWLDGDLSSMPFYNSDGLIAGIILGMLNPGSSSEMAPFVQYQMPNGTEFWGVEANFRDPSMTCNSSSDDNKIGDRLWFADGNHSNYYETPLTQNTTALTEDGWVEGACFVGMGLHYWRYITVDMDCNDSYPIFLLYHSGNLVAWGIALAHDDRPYLTSNRWEHPGGSSLKWFFADGDMPTCLPNQGTLSSQHIYMTSPYGDLCPIL